jgi:hypothetical protein
MGSWAVTLYGSDTARDLRDDLKRIVRAPLDGEEIRAWALDKYPSLGSPAAPEHTDLCLVLADQYWTYGIKHAEVFRTASEIIAGGDDLAVKRELGLGEADLARRARVLSQLAAKWARPNPRPTVRRVRAKPEPFVLEVGDCLAYPTSDGRPRNPYVTAKREAEYYGAYPWRQDGWGAAIVLSRSHHHIVFARYVVAWLALPTDERPTLEAVVKASMRRFDAISFVRSEDGYRDRASPQPYVFTVTTSRSHLARMRVEVIGRVKIDGRRVAAAFDPDRFPIVRYGCTELANHAGTRKHAAANGPISHYLEK